MAMFIAGASRMALIVAGGYLVAFFALASGVVNASIEAVGTRAFIIPTRSVQSLGETVVITLILFVGLAGIMLLQRAAKANAARTQRALLASGFAVLLGGLFLGYLLVSLKL
ncbi:MAG: hypothetical protein ACREAY_04650 [Nitrososphaera sp.]|uniref:hypothetical protein n=1 Tax=Nitrososphaera sp. TaxID=1971748 RepID=UPI003D6F5646